MAYGLRASYSRANHNGTTDYISIYQDGYSGSVLTLDKVRNFRFRHQEITSDSSDGYLNPTYNKILMGVLDFYFWGHDTNTKALIDDIKTADKKEFYIQWAQGTTGNILWQGYQSGRVNSFPEKEKYLAHLQFKDFECLKSQEYTPTDTRQKVIQTIADLISEIGLSSLRYTGNVLRTYTSWQSEGTTLSDDFLNQIYHDTIQLRNYGRLGQEDDTSISVFDALQLTCAPQLLIYQMNGAWNVVQLSAFEDSQNVLRGDYLLNGTQSATTTVNLEVSTFATVDLGTPVITDQTQNTNYPALQGVSVQYDHKSLDANINVPQTVTINGEGEQKYTMNVRLTGDEKIIFSTRNLSRITTPYYHFTTFTNTDVNVAGDTINITPSLDLDQRVKFLATVGSVPGGLNESTIYYSKNGGFDTFPYRIGNNIDITSDGGAGSVSRVLTIEEVTIKNAEFALTLGPTFLDTGTGTFIRAGLSYAGMATTLTPFTPADVDTITDTITINGHGFKDGQLLIFSDNGTTLPSGIDADVYYYAINTTTNTFQISNSYGGSIIDITSIGTGSFTVQRASMVRGLTDTNSTAEYIGNYDFELTQLILDTNVELNLHLFGSRTIQEDEMTSDRFFETNWLDTVVQFIDPSNPESTSIEYLLEQNTQVASDTLQLSPIVYGDGPYIWSRSAYRTSTNLEDITTGWKRRSQVSYVGFEELLLKEVLDTQRSRPSKLDANIVGDYDPVTVLIYDSKYYAYVGGFYDGRWNPTLVEINLTTGSDTLTEVKKVDPSGNQGIIYTPTESEGLTESEADARYLRRTNNLSDVTSAVDSRSNIGLGAGDDVIFGTLELGDNISEDGTIKMWLSSIPDDANITLDNNGGVARFRLDSDTVVEGNLWVDDEVTTARLRTPEITNLAGTAAVWSTSTAVWDTSSLTWTNDVILLNGGISISDTLDVVGDTNMQGNVTLDNNLTVLGTTNLATISSSALTAGRVVLAGTSGVLEDSANLTFNGSLLDVTGQISVDDSSSVSGNSFAVLGANGTITFPYTGETLRLTATTGNAQITAPSDNLEINATKTFINQATDVDGALYALTTLRVDGSVDINNRIDLDYSPTSSGLYALDIQSSEEEVAKFNSTSANNSRITLQSSSTDVLDINYNVLSGNVTFKAYNNAHIGFSTQDSLGFMRERFTIEDGTGVGKFYGEEFNFGSIFDEEGIVNINASITNSPGQIRFFDSSATELARFYQLGPNFNFQSDGGFRFEVDKNNPGTIQALLLDSTGNATFSETLNSTSFTKGTGNTGWVVDGSAGFAIEKDGSSLYNAYFDTLTVRGTLRVFELIAKQISTIGGTELLTAGNGVIESVSGSLGFETVVLEDPNGTGGNAFASGDLVVIQRFNPNNPSSLVKSEWREVVTSSLTTITLQDSTTALSLAGAPAGTSALEPGDYIVIFGNWNTPSVRGNLIYRSVLNDPIVRVQEDIQTYAEFTSPINSTRIAYGDINGFGGFSTRTYGFFAGTDTDNHVTITSTGMQFRNAGDVLAELASNRFVVGNATRYVRFDGATSKIEMAADTFNLATTNLTIDSANELITLGTSPNVVSIGKIGTSPDQFGISLDATNYWYNSGGNTYLSIGSATEFIQFSSTGNLDIASNNFALTGDGIDIDTAGTDIADPNVRQTNSSLAVNWKASVSASPQVGPDFDISESERLSVLQIVFDYDITGGDSSYEFRIEPQFRTISSGTWVSPTMNFPIVTYPSASQTYYNTSPLLATLTDTSGLFSVNSQFTVTSSVDPVSDKVVIYIAADPDSIDYATYDGFRFIVYNTTTESAGSFTADMYIRKYSGSVGINPNGFSIRQADTIWQETVIMQDKLPIRQDRTLIFV